MSEYLVVGMVHKNNTNYTSLPNQNKEILDDGKKEIVTISKDFKAHIAHFVPTQVLGNDCRECRCRNLHGHTIKITAHIKGKINPKTRMVIDYTILKKRFGWFVDEYIDHRFILPLQMFQGNFDEYMSELVRFQSFLETFYVIDPDIENMNMKLLTWDKENGIKEHVNLVEKKNHEIIALIYKSFSLLNTPSTTSEDMARFLVRVLRCMLSDVEGVELAGVRFWETDTSSAYVEEYR